MSVERPAAGEEPNPDLIYGLHDRPPLQETFFVALQHVLAVFVGIITPPVIVAGALKLGAADTAYLVSMSLFVSGAATILQTSQIGPVGSGLLSIQGTSFTFIAPIISAAGAAMSAGASATQALGTVFGLCFAGAFVPMLASRFIRPREHRRHPDRHRYGRDPDRTHVARGQRRECGRGFQCEERRQLRQPGEPRACRARHPSHSGF